MRICFLSVAIWWAGFTLIPLARLRDRPREPGAEAAPAAGSFRQLAETLRSLRAYPQTLLFLAAYLLFNDGIQTIIGLSAQYGDRELELSQTVLISTILLVQFVAFGGALLLGRIAARAGAKRTILGSLVVWVVVLCLAFFLQRGSAVQFYVLGAAIGLVLGGTQALTRSLFAQMTPRGKEAEYFGLYEISDKGTSWLGTLTFGLAVQLTDSYRVAIISPVVFFVAGLAEILGGAVPALDYAGAMLGCCGRVLPMAAQPVEIEAEVVGLDAADPERTVPVRGQHAVATTPGHVRRVRLLPEAPAACPEALEAVRAADAIVLGPGSWFTSVLPHFLVPALSDAIVTSSARRILVLNLSTEVETDGWSIEEHLAALTQHVPKLTVDAVLADPGAVRDGARLARAAESLSGRLVVEPVAVADGSPLHDPGALATALRSVLQAPS